MNKELLSQCEKAINKSIIDTLSAYNSPLKDAVNDSIKEHQETIKNIAAEAVADLVDSEDFKCIIKEEIKKKLARVFISSIGGSIEKTVNTIKQDPTSKAKMTIAIDAVMSELIGE